MLIVRIELHSAVTGKISEIGRMRIYNDGTGDGRRGNYVVERMRRGKPKTVQRTGRVDNYPRQSLPVWKLVRRAIDAVF